MPGSVSVLPNHSAPMACCHSRSGSPASAAYRHSRQQVQRGSTSRTDCTINSAKRRSPQPRSQRIRDAPRDVPLELERESSRPASPGSPTISCDFSAQLRSSRAAPTSSVQGSMDDALCSTCGKAGWRMRSKEFAKAPLRGLPREVEELRRLARGEAPLYSVQRDQTSA